MSRIVVQDPDFTLHLGDVTETLAAMPDESVHCCVTSPPYWGLRDYGVDGQLGLEPTPELYVENMVAVFRQVRRVLRKDGTLWLNIGDSYAANRSYQVSDSKHQAHEFADANAMSVPAGLKPKDLVGIPWRLAFALQADGWYLRSDIIWSKPNPMPESVTDRPTKSHEYVFLLTRSPRYFFDQEAVREAAEWSRWGDQTYSPEAEKMYGQRIKPRPKADLTPRNDGDRWNEANGRGFIPNQSGRNVRSVWEIATQPYPEAHFATYPEALVERCVKAGCPEGGVVLDPFLGSGTTALVARKLGRRSVGIELNETYAELAAKRLSQLSLLAA